MYFQDLISRLDEFWKKQGCVIVQPYDIEVGAGTFHPMTFFKSLGNKPWRVAFTQASRRPTDGRYADNPLRMQRYYQYQVIIKPSPKDIQSIYLKSLQFLGIKTKNHDIRFVEDDWESPTLGANGLGWEVWLDSLEITQYTYFQQIGGFQLKVIPCELTYGLERICMFLQNTDDVFKIKWNKDTNYADIHKSDEKENSEYNFQKSDPETLLRLFDIHEKESRRLIGEDLLIPAYENMLKTSHIFNLLDARGTISVNERAAYIGRVRKLATACAELYMENARGIVSRD